MSPFTLSNFLQLVCVIENFFIQFSYRIWSRWTTRGALKESKNLSQKGKHKKMKQKRWTHNIFIQPFSVHVRKTDIQKIQLIPTAGSRGHFTEQNQRPAERGRIRVQPLLSWGSGRVGCSGSCSVRFLISPRWRPKPLWAISFAVKQQKSLFRKKQGDHS